MATLKNGIKRVVDGQVTTVKNHYELRKLTLDGRNLPIERL